MAIGTTCIVQEGLVSDDQQAILRSMLSDIAQEFFNEPAEINWIVVSKGNGFTAGQPSRAALVSMGAPADFNEDTRYNLLKRISDAWSEENGCHINDIVASAISAQTG